LILKFKENSSAKTGRDGGGEGAGGAGGVGGGGGGGAGGNGQMHVVLVWIMVFLQLALEI